MWVGRPDRHPQPTVSVNRHLHRVDQSRKHVFGGKQIDLHSCGDFHLASYEKSIRYFQALDEASDRLTLQPVGETSEGRPFYLALVSCPPTTWPTSIATGRAHSVRLTDEEARDRE